MAEKELYRYETYQNETSYRRVCVAIPPAINTNGIGGSFNKPFEYSLSLLELQVMIIISFNLIFHFIFKRLGFPKLITQISAGLAIGGLLNHPNFKSQTDQLAVFSLQSQQILDTLTQFGYMLFLFIIGVKMDMKMIMTTGRKAWAVGVISLMAPVIVSSSFGWVLLRVNPDLKDNKRMMGDIFNLAVTQSLTTFPVISYLLSELEIINSELGRLALSSGVISEFLSIFLLTMATSLIVMNDAQKRFSGGTGNPYLNILLLFVFLIAAVFVIRPAMFWVIKRTPQGRPVKDSYIMIIIVGVILFSMASHGFGQFVLFAPYILGYVMPDGPPLGSALVEKLDTFVLGMLMPIYVTTCATRVTFFPIGDLSDPQVYGVIFVAIIIFTVKVGACLVTTIFGFKMPWNDGLALSLIMSAKGIVEMATYSFLRDSEMITERSFTIAAFVTMVTAGIIPIIVKRLYDPSRKYAGYQKRNISCLRSNDELRVLVCVHRPDNIGSVIKLLDASNPSSETPVAVFVLHLMELVGRTTPIFISHQYHNRTISDLSYSENVIMAFEQYEVSRERDAVSVQMFTAISPPKLMHEDIGTLALNKLTSLIIMPFHRKWGMDGSIESENHNIRALNCNLLDLAPCSIGILIDRSRLIRSTSLGASSHSTTTYRIAMIFIGGDDDREALAYAKRMAGGSSSRIGLTVIRFLDKNGEGSKEWDWVMDTEALKEVKLKNQMNNDTTTDGRFRYREEMVGDGTEMALRLRAMAVDHFDLVLVGRRLNLECSQTSGMKQWSEYPELGVVGDLLASPDLESRASVLVVQQQRMAACMHA